MFRGLGALVLHRLDGHVLVEDVCVSHRRLDVRVVERLLDDLQVAAVAEELGREVVPLVVEPEIFDA